MSVVSQAQGSAPKNSALKATAPKTTAPEITPPKAMAPKIIEPKTIAELEAMHTGTLMSRRQALLKCAETCTLTAQDKASLFTPIQYKDTVIWQNAYRELKSVLDKREHLPNKQERKALRQAKAKSKR